MKRHLIDYLPAIYQELSGPGESTFLASFLRAFEGILLGSSGHPRIRRNEAADDDAEGQYEALGLQEKIAELHRLFDPIHTPEEFLPWLSSWTALTLRSDLSSARKRQLIARMIPLYRIRGTRKYVEELLRLHLDAIPLVIDFEMPALQVGSHSMIGDDTRLRGGPPHFFRVVLVAPLLSERELEAQRQIARSIIEQAKPAHTFYELETASPRLELGVRSRLGMDTVLSPAAV